MQKWSHSESKVGDRVNLLFTDIDSLCISVNTDDVYEDMKELQNELDCSDYPTDHPLHSVKNKALDKFKDEMSVKIIEEYVGLKSKMYSIKWPEGNVRICKGISKSVNKVVLRHEMYKECLMNVELRKNKVARIGSKLHQIYTYSFSKISLSPFDDKKYILHDKINTLAYGHYVYFADMSGKSETTALHPS